MPLCLLCPAGNQPSFLEIGELTNHVSEVHSKVPPSAAGHIPTLRPPPATQCCVCNKKFNSSFALASHQKAKQHYPARSASPRFASSEELANQSETRRGPRSSIAPDGDAMVSKLDVPEQRVAHCCSQCHATFDSLAELQTHRSSHGKISCSKCSHLFSSLLEWNDHFKQAHQNVPSSTGQEDATSTSGAILVSHRSPSPAIVRPASSQSVSNKGITSNGRSKGFVCNLCNKEFKSQAGLQAHTTAKHLAGAECVICHVICPSTAALERHVDTIHSCAVCQDGILRDVQTLSDHMIGHSRPVVCKQCGTRYQTEEERNLHFAAADNYHPVCVACRLGFEDDNALHAHVNLVHPASSEPMLESTADQFSTESAVAAHANAAHLHVFQCDVCHEACSSQTELDVHIVTAHSCPICHDGIYMDMRALEEHLEQHRSPYMCHSCDLAYTGEDQLLEHYRDSPNDVHPYCEKCHLGFEDNGTYASHVNEMHPRIACDICEDEFFDSEELPCHYLRSRGHPTCEKCGIGFRDQFDYTDHGASAHPECHCYLCQWHFDTPDILQSHIKHFFNHPKCEDCNIRFSDAEAYQYHLFTIHRPRFDDQGHANVESDREDKALRNELCSPLLCARAVDPVWGFEGSGSLPYASFVPLPPSLSGYSSPASQRVIAESGGSLGSHSRSSTLSVEQHSPTNGHLWNTTIRSLSLDVGHELKASPEFDHSPLSTLPAVGTPLISHASTIQSVDSDSPFSPRPEPSALLPLSHTITSDAVTVVEHDDADSESSSSFARSPPLISPVVKLPDPGAVSPSTTSSWTMTSDADSRSSPQPRSTTSSKGMNGMLSVGQTTNLDHSVPQLSLLVPSSAQLTGSARWCHSGYPSSISPESAGISVSASMTPEYIREARAYLSLTRQAQEPPSPPISRSPGISSPILSSTGLNLGERGRRREVRFEDNIMSEPAWGRQSTSSDSSLDPPVVLPRSGNLKTNGVSKLPRFSALRRPTRRWSNGQTNHASPRGYNRRPNGTPAPPPSYHCRSCYRDHCEEPTTTTCGHLFCYECISTAIMKDPHCPVCEAPTLLYCLFRIDTLA